jgi:hypothetical protein
MKQLKEFLKTSARIHPEAEEVSIFAGTVEENLFDAKKAPKELLVELVHCMGTIFNEGVDLDRLEQFSFQDADGISYFEPKLMLVYSGGREAARLTDLPITEAHEHYCINYFLESKVSKQKFYDLHIENHRHPELPEGSYYASPFGLGISNDGMRKDVYFVHCDLRGVARHFDLPPPTVAALLNIDEDLAVEKVFGLTYEAASLKPLKLKRYFYPQDPYLKSILFDEVRASP